MMVLVLALAATPAWGTWDAAALRDESTLDLLTVGPEEGEHWSRLWLVVLDGEMYVRLGSRAAERVEANSTAPRVQVRVGGKQYDRVRAVPAPEKSDAVATAMGEKYWSDLLIRYFPHPLTLRLVPENAE